MFRFVGATTFDTSSPTEMVQKHCMFPLPAILALRNARVYVSTSDSSNITPYIKTPVNETFSLTTALNVLYIDPHNSHI